MFHILHLPVRVCLRSVRHSIIRRIPASSLTNKSFSSSHFSLNKKPNELQQNKVNKASKPSSVAPTSKVQQQVVQLTQQIQKIIPPHENIYTIPNILTFTRLLSAPAIGYLITHDHRIMGASLFAYSCITDFVDGYIARKYNMGSVLGSIIDPMADKMLMVICTFCLAHSGEMPLAVAGIIIGRDILLAMSAIYYRYISLPPPKTLLRYWDFSIPSASVHPTTISKYNTGFQMVYIASLVCEPVVQRLLSPENFAFFTSGIIGAGYFVSATTILSGLSYVFSKNAVKILSQKN